MITIFNRKELISTFDISRQAKVRELLAVNQIPYNVRAKNRYSLFASHRTNLNSNFDYEYTIFVKKSDFDRADYLINNKN